MGDKKIKFEIEVEIQEDRNQFYAFNDELDISCESRTEEGALTAFFNDFLMLYYKLNEKGATLTTEYKYIKSIINNCVIKKKR